MGDKVQRGTLSPRHILRNCLRSRECEGQCPSRTPFLAGLGHRCGRDRPENRLLEGRSPSKPSFSDSFLVQASICLSQVLTTDYRPLTTSKRWSVVHRC